MTTVALSLRVVSALRAGAVLVARPRGVVHLHTGALTRSGRAVPAADRPLCRVTTRRLHVGRVGALPAADFGVTDAGDLTVGPRRLCRTCLRVLPTVDTPTRLDDERALFDQLTIHDFARAGAWCRTVDETHQVSRLLRGTHGGKPSHEHINPALFAAHTAVLDRRARLVAATRTPEEIAAAEAQRRDDALDGARITEGRRRENRHARLADRALRGKYLTQHERDDLARTG